MTAQLLRRKDAGTPALSWELHRPAGTPRVAVLLTHGYGEHRLRYGEVIASWLERGVMVASYDLRGHGTSEGVRGYVESFGDYVTDALDLLDRLDEESDWRALEGPVLFGHSLGGLIAVHVALAAQKRARGLALSSPYIALAMEVPAVKRFAARLLSRLVPTFGMPSGLKGADVTHDPKIAALYDSDPLNLKKATARWFTESSAAQEEALARAGELTLPLFCLHAGADKTTLPSASEELVRRAGSREKSYRALPGLYHEILNEPERATFIAEYADVFDRWRPGAAAAKTAT